MHSKIQGTHTYVTGHGTEPASARRKLLPCESRAAEAPSVDEAWDALPGRNDPMVYVPLVFVRVGAKRLPDVTVIDGKDDAATPTHRHAHEP